MISFIFLLRLGSGYFFQLRTLDTGSDPVSFSGSLVCRQADLRSLAGKDPFPDLCLMKINLERVNNAVHLHGSNQDGLTVSMDGSDAIGGENLGVRPMELLLMSLGSCSSMDVLSILAKMKQEVDSYRVEVDGTRQEGEVPAVFTKIHVQYFLSGKLEKEKVARAIQLSMEKYCSVTKMLEASVEITHGFDISST